MELKRKALVASGVVGTMMAGGVVALSLFGTSAGAQTAAGTTTTTTPAASTPTPGTPPSGAPAPNGQAPNGQGPNGQFDPTKGGHMANGITETLLTGDNLAKATAAAKAAEPGATIIRVETDADGATYEAHMQKSDGSTVTVKLNADFSVKGTENGM